MISFRTLWCPMRRIFIFLYVNKRHCRCWSAENLNIIHELPLHSQNLTVWCGNTCERISGPYFFENENGVTATVTGTSYRKCILKFLMPEINDINFNTWFQQDDVTPNQELSVLYGGPTINYGRQLSLYVPYMLHVNMTGDLAHLQLSALQGETRPICRTSDLQGERMLICRTYWSFSLFE